MTRRWAVSVALVALACAPESNEDLFPNGGGDAGMGGVVSGSGSGAAVATGGSGAATGGGGVVGGSAGAVVGGSGGGVVGGSGGAMTGGSGGAVIGGSGGAGTGGGGGKACAEATEEYRVALAQALQCVALSAELQCEFTVRGPCCPTTVNDGESVEKLGALVDALLAACGPPVCPAIACRETPSRDCMLLAPNRPGYCL